MGSWRKGPATVPAGSGPPQRRSRWRQESVHPGARQHPGSRIQPRHARPEAGQRPRMFPDSLGQGATCRRFYTRGSVPHLTPRTRANPFGHLAVGFVMVDGQRTRSRPTPAIGSAAGPDGRVTHAWIPKHLDPACGLRHRAGCLRRHSRASYRHNGPAPAGPNRRSLASGSNPPSEPDSPHGPLPVRG